MKFYRYTDLKAAGIPWTRKHLFYLEKDGQFPRRVRLGPGTICWPADEVDAFVAERVNAREEVAADAA
jgi:prophage regulatory protein